jgi:hypothetical protein
MYLHFPICLHGVVLNKVHGQLYLLPLLNIIHIVPQNSIYLAVLLSISLS